MEKVNFVRDYIKLSSASDQYYLYRSFINCLSSKEVCSAFDKSFNQGTYNRRALLQKIELDMSISFESFHHQLVEELVKNLDSLPHSKRQSCANFISRVFEFLPNELKENVMVTFLSHRVKSIRERAYKQLMKEWNPDFERTILEQWELYKDDICIELIIEHFPVETVLSIFDELSEMCSEKGYRKLFLKVAAYDSTKLDLIRKYDEITYLYTLAKIGSSVSEKEATEIYEKNKSDERYGLLVWCFGQMKLWDVLSQIYKDIENDPFRAEFYMR